MSKIVHAKIALTVITCAFWQAATAGDQVLEFKLVTLPVEVKTMDVKQVEGQTMGVMKASGVAYFKDGRVASKEFTFGWDQNKGVGPFYGYSTYTFEDGSTIMARFAGTGQAGKPMHGDYTVLSGTGAFVGAKGTGSFDAVPHKLSGANLFNGRFTISTP